MMHTGVRVTGAWLCSYRATLEVGSLPVFHLYLQGRADQLSRIARNKNAAPVEHSRSRWVLRGVCRFPDRRLLLRFGYETVEEARGGPRFGKALRGGGRGGAITARDTRRHREERRMIGATG